jgi:hypothetical protein
VVANGERFFGKDRIDWVAEICRIGEAVNQTVI